jgi:tetratricopeptide (TPR) repeat protein
MARGADRAQGFALLGEVFAARGLHGEALERYREARLAAGTAIGEGTARDALFGETRALLMLGRAAEAQSAAEELLAADGDRVETLLLVARVWSESGEHRRAIALLETARDRAPRRTDVLEAMGDVARAAGNDEEALAAYRGALAVDGDLALVRFAVARLLATRGDGEGAERELAAALESVPTYADAAMELARVRRRFGRAREALTPLVELLRRDPYNLDGLLLLGETLVELGQPRDAAVAFDRILRFDPEHAGALYFQGAILAERGRFGDAIVQWRELIALAPDSPYAERARRDARSAELQQIFTGEWEAVRAD